MESGKVSVIIPVYNASLFLEEAVNSALVIPQVGEIILVDDGSIDGSLELCFQLKQVNSKINVLTHLNHLNLGVSASRNLGIKAAKFEYIAFLDSDDVYYTNRFEGVLKKLESDPTIDACYGLVKVKYPNREKEFIMGPKKKIHPKELFSYLLNGGYFHTNAVTIKKSFLEKIGGFDPEIKNHEDVEFWIRMAFNGKIVALDYNKPIAEYLYHGQGLISSANWKSKWLLWFSIFTEYFFLSITWRDRYHLLKQLFKAAFSSLKFN